MRYENIVTKLLRINKLQLESNLPLQSASKSFILSNWYFNNNRSENCKFATLSEGVYAKQWVQFLFVFLCD